jgi:MFS family permease
MDARPVTASTPSIWRPLRGSAFRGLWIALAASSIGVWMQTVGAQWLLIDEPNASTLVAGVQTATMLPALLLALPAGALADTFDRRRLLIAVQVYLVTVAVALTALTAVDQMSPALLLTLTFALGVGNTLTLPAWQALIPEVVPRTQIPAASSLAAITLNASRSIGPAIAGLLISAAGVPAVFGFTAAGYLFFALVLAWWRPDPGEASAPERFTAAVRAGGRYVRHSLVVRRVLLRALLFVMPGSAIWALLPLAAVRLGMDSTGYSLLLVALGVGSVGGALVLPVLRARMTENQLLALASIVYAASTVLVAVAPTTLLAVLALPPAGTAWVSVLSGINVELQMFLPGWVRARGLAVLQVVLAGGQAIGSLFWGVLADITGLGVAMVGAAAVLIAGAATIPKWPLRDTRGLNRDPAVYWPEPQLVLEPHGTTGPILIIARYRVRPQNVDAFIDAMQAVRRIRMQTGASRWGLYRDGEILDTFVEVYRVPSWDEHMRQHEGRLTGSDKVLEDRARSLAEGPPEVMHLLPADTQPL